MNSDNKKGNKIINYSKERIERVLKADPGLATHYDPEIRKELEDNLFKNIENRAWHNSYDQELRELSAIENGDIQLLEKSWNEFAMGKVGAMAENPLINEKINAVVVITTSSRAAIKGGMSSETSFTLSDIYFQRIEKVKELGEPMKLARDAQFLYCTLINELKSSNQSHHSLVENEHIDGCKDYVFRHLHEKISVAEIADALGLNADYLSSLFKKTEGISLTTYILNNKIALVKNLLIYSNYTYSEIANYLGFSSQSHLGDRFKKITGFTMKEYRTRFQMKDFMD